MKTVFLITALWVLQLKAQTGVDKQVSSVDNGDQHQLSCKAISQNQDYELKVFENSMRN